MKRNSIFSVVTESINAISEIDFRIFRLLLIFVFVGILISVLETMSYFLDALWLSVLDFFIYMLFVYFSHLAFLIENTASIPVYKVKFKVFIRFVAHYFFLGAVLFVSYIISENLLDRLFTEDFKYQNFIVQFVFFLLMLIPSIFIARCGVFLPAIVSESTLTLNEVFFKTKGYSILIVVLVWIVAAISTSIPLFILDNYIYENILSPLLQYILVFLCVSILCVTFKNIEKTNV